MNSQAALAGSLTTPGRFDYAPAIALSTPSWTGAYAGVHAGFGWADADVVDYGAPVPGGFGGFACAPAVVPYCGQPFSYDAEGWIGGMQLGYNWERLGFIFGLEGEFGRLDIHKDAERDRGAADRDVAGVDYGWYGTVTGRFGVPINRTLVYVKGGLVFADLLNHGSDLDDDNSAPGLWYIDALSSTRTRRIDTGWALGGGLEYALSSRWMVKAEYLYMNFGDEISYDVDGDGYKHENELQTFKLGLNYKLHAADAFHYASLKDPTPAWEPALWDSAYLGVHGGYAANRSRTVDFGTPVGFGGFACDPAGYCGAPFIYNVDGWYGGLQGGRNWRSGRLVYGIEGEFGRIDLQDEEMLHRNAVDRDWVRIDYGWYGTLTGRLGLPVRDHALLYVKGGAAFAEITNKASDLDKTNNEAWYYDTTSYTAIHGLETGWALGGGLEYALRDRWTLKAEYLYMDFGSKTSTDNDGDSYKHDNELHTVKVGLNYALHRPDVMTESMK